MFGKEKKQKKLLDDLPAQFLQVQKKYNLPFGDFPPVAVFRDLIKEFDISKFPKLDMKAIDNLDQVLGKRIPDLMRYVPDAPIEGAALGGPQSPTGAAGKDMGSSPDKESLTPPAYASYENAHDNPFPEEDNNPFADDPMMEKPGQAWSIPSYFQEEKTSEFYNMHLASGKLSGAGARDVFTKLGLQKSDLRAIWTLADMDKDGFLDCDEYILATYLIDLRKKENKMYDTLPFDLTPPSKR
jgi:EH domain-containing protein 1